MSRTFFAGAAKRSGSQVDAGKGWLSLSTTIRMCSPGR